MNIENRLVILICVIVGFFYYIEIVYLYISVCEFGQRELIFEVLDGIVVLSFYS